MLLEQENILLEKKYDDEKKKKLHAQIEAETRLLEAQRINAKRRQEIQNSIKMAKMNNFQLLRYELTKSQEYNLLEEQLKREEFKKEEQKKIEEERKIVKLDIMQKMEEDIKKQKAEEMKAQVFFEKRQQNKIESLQRRKLLAAQRINDNGATQNQESFYKPTHVTQIFKQSSEIKTSQRANNSGTKSVAVEKKMKNKTDLKIQALKKK